MCRKYAVAHEVKLIKCWTKFKVNNCTIRISIRKLKINRTNSNKDSVHNHHFAYSLLTNLSIGHDRCDWPHKCVIKLQTEVGKYRPDG